MKHPAPFRERKPLPDTLTPDGDIVRTTVSAEMARAAVGEYRSVGGLPAQGNLIVDVPSRVVDEAPAVSTVPVKNSLKLRF